MEIGEQCGPASSSDTAGKITVRPLKGTYLPPFLTPVVALVTSSSGGYWSVVAYRLKPEAYWFVWSHCHSPIRGVQSLCFRLSVESGGQHFRCYPRSTSRAFFFLTIETSREFLQTVMRPAIWGQRAPHTLTSQLNLSLLLNPSLLLGITFLLYLLELSGVVGTSPEVNDTGKT